MASGCSLASFSDPGVAQRTRWEFVRLVLEAHGLRRSDGLVTVLWVGCVGCGASWLSETGGSTTLSVTDGSRRRGGDRTSRFPLCPVANLRNFNAPNPCPKRIRTLPAAQDTSAQYGQYRRPVPAEIGHSRDQSGPQMQTAPPSRIMLGGAVLKSGQCNPPAIICLRRRSKVQRPGAVEAALFVDLVALMLLSRRALFTRGSAAPPTTLPATSGSRRAGGRRRSRGMNPTSSA